MAGNFDPTDRTSWYFGPMGRQEAADILLAEKETGVFLVRDSSTISGDFVLSVKEDNKVSHYIVNRIQRDESIQFRIGEQIFDDFPRLLEFYKYHYLDTTPLIRPAKKKVEKIIANYDFDGRDPDDLPFRKGEVLTVVSKDEQQWWTAVNDAGRQGSIPVNYVQKYDVSASAEQKIQQERSWSSPTGGSSPQKTGLHTNSVPPTVYTLPNVHHKKPPFKVRVKQDRNPSAYDPTQLKLKAGDIINVLHVNINGQWEGILEGTEKKGHFPFTHVEIVDGDETLADSSLI